MLIGLGVVVLFAAGCGEETIDDGKVEDFIRDNATAPELVRDVDCPADEEIEQGARFECRIATARGGREVATIRQIDEGRFVWAGGRVVQLPAGQRYAVPENVEAFVRAQAPRPGQLVSVDCPPDVRLRKGTTFECVARFVDGSSAIVEVEQTDRLGNVRIAGSRPGGRRGS